jgi:predicted negative regulator of RcsB-dependent stress response
MLAAGEYEQGLKLIAEVDPASAASFSGNYDELVGDLYVALDRLDEARTSYQKALRDGHQSPFLQAKIDDLTAPEIVEIKK